MIRRLAAFVLLVWAIGFLWFAVFLPQPVGDAKTDAVIVTTGGPGRVARGLDVVRSDNARLLLVSGVDRRVRPAEFAESFGVSDAVMECCVTLGFAAVDTRSNAAETLDWVRRNKVRSLRLVTSDWHMRRAAGELRYRLPPNIRIVEDAVRSQPSFLILFAEYNKFLASGIAHLVNL